MKHILSYLASVVLISFFFSVLFWYVSPEKYKSFSVYAPIPRFLSLKENKQVNTLDLWFPFLQKSEASEENSIPHLTASSVLMYDLATNKVLFEKEPTLRRPMASLTKIMTAIIGLENRRSDNRYTVPASAIVGEDSMGLTAGEVLGFDDLLYGLMLPSGNDAAEVIASNYPEGRAAFVKAMNDKAAALGLTNTHFTNPSGLQGDGDQYTTAHDLLVITRFALDNYSEFGKVVSTVSHTISQTATHKEFDLANETNLLTTYPGVKGVKTGYTPEAGLCLVTLLEYHNHRIIGVLMNSENRRAEMKELLDYSLKSVSVTPPAHD